MSYRLKSLLAFTLLLSASLAAAEKPINYYKENAAIILSNKFKDVQFEHDPDNPKEFLYQHNVRKFTIYRLNKAGDWQRPTEMKGPDRGGIIIRFMVVDQPWQGALVVPYSGTRDYHVFKETHIIKSSADNTSHIWVGILTPKVDPPTQELKALIALFNAFGNSRQ